MSAAPAEILRLLRIFEDARPVPLMRDRVRVDKREVETLIKAVERQAGPGVRLNVVLAEVRELVRNAKPLPLTDEVRISPAQARDAVARLQTVSGLC